MVNFLKPGKVVIILNGRFAGKKAVITEVKPKKDKRHHYARAVVAGLKRSPKKVTRAMGKKVVLRRTIIRPFLKTVNLSHVLPTRYTLDVPLKDLLSEQKLHDRIKRKTVRKTIAKLFQQKYKTGESKWFFDRLRF
ncbi:MAG: putative 60s ribosomal protein l27 [Streblomastix strix]|uniref:Putative 60s ribosomal protein l27 n=1 Tax=Streblomastix strix TaxID=222440 RepID=A0A5J4VXB9_9EUKA|nr:MAG: putative 60s ribosomal protein l27 [Streblomastix strix]